MHKIWVCEGSNATGAWHGGLPDLGVIKSGGWTDVLIMVADGDKDNPRMADEYNAVIAAGMGAGFGLRLRDGCKASYGQQMITLQTFCNTGYKLALPPTLIFEGSARNSHAVRGDFMSYYGQFVMKFPNTLICLNTSSKDMLMKPDASFPADTEARDIRDLTAMLLKAKLWLAAWGNTAPSAAKCTPWKDAFVWGKSAQENLIGDVPVVEPPVDGGIPPYQLLIDIWEGNPTLDYSILKAAGIVGAIVRINDMSGGHHMDELFTARWQEVNKQLQANAIYFVYNPWVDGKGNYAWLKAHLPAGHKGRVFVDVEVAMPGYPATVYSGELGAFLRLAKTDGLPTAIYTGGGFVSIVSNWPQVEYWWADYSAVLTASKTWDEYKRNLFGMKFDTWTKPAPYTVRLWQSTGDHCILPGMGGHAVDINAFPGSLSDLQTWLGCTPTPPVPVELTDTEKLKRLWAAHPELH